MRQFSYNLDFRQTTPQIIRSSAFFKPMEMLSVVQKDGQIRLHALVDTSAPERDHAFLVCGTGSNIKDDLAHHLAKVGSVQLGDENQFGYHVYYLKDSAPSELVTAFNTAFSLDVEFSNDPAQHVNIELLKQVVQNVALSYKTTMRIVEGDHSLSIQFAHAEFRKGEVLSKMMAVCLGNDGVSHVKISPIVEQNL